MGTPASPELVGPRRHHDAMKALRVTPSICLALLSALAVPTRGQFDPVPAPQTPPWCPAGTGCTSEVHTTFEGSPVRGAVTFRIGSDNVFDRPVLLVEGFDFGSGWDPNSHGYGNVTWNDIHAGDLVEFPQGLEYRPLLDSLHERGLDLLFVDFEHGTASLNAKSALLDHVLTLALSAKTGSRPAVLAGVSMGGLVVRTTLAQWEDEGTPHCVGQYYSVDAPHLGANLPVGLQALVLGLSTVSLDGSELWQALNSDAAHELLQHHIAESPSFLESQSHLQQLGWPRRSVNLNVINSHPDGWEVLSDSALIFLEWGVPPPVSLNAFHVKAFRWTPSPDPALAATFVLPTGEMPWTEGGAIHTGSLAFTQPDSDPEPLPGSVSSHVSRISEALKSSIPLPLLSETVQPHVTFVSHLSALGLGSEEFSPWMGVSTAPPYAPREVHASLGNHHRTWMLSWLEGLEFMPPSSLPEEGLAGWTLGWQAPHSRHLSGLEIHDGGTVTVGNNATPFEAFTSPCPGEVAVHSGGVLNVGSASGALGKLRVGAGTSISILEGGAVAVNSGSKLTVEQHGTLVVDGGTFTVHESGALILEHGGKIVLRNGAVLNLSDPASLAQVHGRITVPAGSHATLSNEGNLELGLNAEVWLEPGSNFHWNQLNAGTTHLTGPASFLGDGHAHMDGGLWEWEDDATLNCNADFHWHSVDLLAWNANGNQVKSTRNVAFEQCNLAGICWEHEATPANSTLLRILESSVEHGFCRLTNARVQLLSNVFHHTPIEIKTPLPPTKLVQNLFEDTWASTAPAVTLENGEESTWVEGNAWEGGVGLRLVDASVSSNCNRWTECTRAVELAGESEACFQAGCGGGSNRWWNNEVHFHLENAPFPLLGLGNNHLGAASSDVISGSTSDNGPTWVVSGASWDAELLENPWYSPFPSSVAHCNENGCESIPCWAENMIAQSECMSNEPPKPDQAKSKLAGTWNILGQEVPAAYETDPTKIYGWN